MKIHSVKFENFMLFKNMFRVFGDKEVIGIIAEYADNANRSNRGGKTTVLEGIRYAFNGSSRAPRNVDLIHHGEKEMFVEVVLIDGTTKHIIRRGVDAKGNSWIDADKITKADEAQKYINELLGFNSTDFDLTCFFKQQDINQFMEMKPREKQKHLMQWLNNQHWLVLERKVLDDLSELNKKMTARKSKRDVLASQIVDPDKIEAELENQKSWLADNIEKRVILQKQLAKMLESVLSAKQRYDLKTRLETVNANAQRMEKQYLERVAAAEEMKAVQKQLAALPESTLAVDAEAVANQALAKAVADQQTLMDQVKEAKEQLTGVCPILKKACDRIQFNPAHVTAWQDQLTKIKAKVVKQRGVLVEIAAAKRAESHRQGLQSMVAVLVERSAGQGASRAEFDRLKAEKNELEKQLVSGVSEDAAGKVRLAREDLSQADENIAKFNMKIGTLQEQLKRSALTKKHLDKVEERILKTQARIDVRKYVAFMFGRNGIPAQEIENGFEEIEDETNFVLQKFGTNMSIMFDPDRELQAWEPACLACETAFPKGAKSKNCLTCGVERQKKRKDELTVKVLENGEEHDFELDSGGGKTIISFSNRLALTRLKQRKSGSNFNVLFLDEPDSALDRPNKKAFMDLITTTLIKKFGFEQVLWISHNKTICESIPHILKVVRHETHSTAGWL